MVNKILTLFDMEFKRVQKIFFTIISLLILGNILAFVRGIYWTINYQGAQTKVKQGLGVLTNNMGKETLLNSAIPDIIYPISNTLMILALIWCAFYCVLIWYRDFSSKSKSIYTLFMLPENKFIIFISKLLTMVVLIYMIIFTQHLCWAIEGFLINKYTNIPMINMIESINNIGKVGLFRIAVRIYPMEILMIYIIGPIVGVTALFAAVLMSKSIKKVGGIMGILYILGLGVYYLSITGVYEYSDIILKNNIIFFTVVFIISICTSYNLLKNKMYD